MRDRPPPERGAFLETLDSTDTFDAKKKENEHEYNENVHSVEKNEMEKVGLTNLKWFWLHNLRSWMHFRRRDRQHCLLPDVGEHFRNFRL